LRAASAARSHAELESPALVQLNHIAIRVAHEDRLCPGSKQSQPWGSVHSVWVRMLPQRYYDCC